VPTGALASSCEVRAVTSAQPFSKLVSRDGTVILLREVHVVGELCLEIDQRIAQTCDPAREAAIELAKRRLRLSWNRGVYQISDGFRLQQVQLPVEHCTAGELAGQCVPRARGIERRKQSRDHRTPP
jgi:hypothetical protein